MTTAAEQKQVLDMLAAGTINAEEAEQLLEKLHGAGNGSGQAADRETRSGRPRPRNAKRLRVEIQEEDGEVTKLCVPMMLVRTGQALNAMLPEWVTRKVIVNGADLSELCNLEGDALLDAVHDLEVRCGSDTVRIYCE